MSEGKVTLYTEELTGKYEGFVVTQDEVDEAMKNQGFDWFLPSHTCILHCIMELRFSKARHEDIKNVFDKEIDNRADSEWGEYMRLRSKFRNQPLEHDVIKKEVIKSWEREIIKGEIK